MAVSPIHPADRQPDPPRPDAAKQWSALSHFDALFAPTIASWPSTKSELMWLAPGTRAPLTAAKVVAWAKPGGYRLLYWAGGATPAGYAEINPMNGMRGQWWIGHFVIDPNLRGRGLGRRFFHELVRVAFESLAAEQMLLVVFPENEAAIRCYEHGGMTVEGREQKRFANTRQRHTFLRMTLRRVRYQKTRQYAALRGHSPLILENARAAAEISNRFELPPKTSLRIAPGS